MCVCVCVTINDRRCKDRRSWYLLFPAFRRMSLASHTSLCLVLGLLSTVLPGLSQQQGMSLFVHNIQRELLTTIMHITHALVYGFEVIADACYRMDCFRALGKRYNTTLAHYSLVGSSGILSLWCRMVWVTFPRRGIMWFLSRL